MLLFIQPSYLFAWSSFDLTRCDESGSPHRRVLGCDSFASHQQSSASGIMDFSFFPNYGSHTSSQTLVAALRNGEVNVIDMRIPHGAPVGSTAPATKLYRSQSRSNSSSSALSSTHRLAGTHDQTNPPAAVVVSKCGYKMHVFTEMGGVEVWDTRNMRAAYERVVMIDAIWSASNPNSANSYAAAVVASTTAASSPASHLVPSSSSSSSSSSTPSARSLGFEFRQPSSRICSASSHPQDDSLFTFQLLNGCVGLLDLNPSSPSYQTCTSLVSFDADFVSSGDEFALRTRRTHAFIPNGQGGTRASARREKRIAIGNTKNQIQVWGRTKHAVVGWKANLPNRILILLGFSLRIVCFLLSQNLAILRRVAILCHLHLHLPHQIRLSHALLLVPIA